VLQRTFGRVSMRRLRFVPLLIASTVVLAARCARTNENKTEMKLQTTTTTSQGTTERKTEATQVGSTLEMKTETKTDTSHGTVKGKAETYVGTVTKYEPGKSIEVMTGEKNTHSFSLDEKGVTSNVDPGVKIGSKVRLVDQKGDDQARAITVTLQGA
jgi:hypothetical protein